MEIRLREVESGKILAKGVAPAIGVIIFDENGNLRLAGGLPAPAAALAVEMIRQAWVSPAISQVPAPLDGPNIVVPRIMPPGDVGRRNDGQGMG